MKQILFCLVLIGLVASKATIPELYKLNNGSFTRDYSVTYYNEVDSGEFGVLSEAGDINNDGIPDFILANPAGDNNRGIVYVIYGKKGSLRQPTTMDYFQPSDGFMIRGASDGQKLGCSVSHAGDVNGDGIDDIIIGTSFCSNYEGRPNVIAAFVLFGRKSSSEFPSIIEVSRWSSTHGVKISGTCKSKSSTKASVSGAGDVNGDGISDIMVGDPNFNIVYVYFGSKQGLTDMDDNPSQGGKGFIVKGYNDALGASLSKVGDFNGDGIDDIILGARIEENLYANFLDKNGRAYLIYGRKEKYPSSIYVERLKASEGLIIKGAREGDRFGCSVSHAGDFNGDGLQDVIVGAKNSYNYQGYRGSAYVILGSRQNPDVLSVNTLSPSRGFSMYSAKANYNSQLGLQVSGGRDLNGDGLGDVIVTAPGFNNSKGAAYVVYGFKSNSSLPDLQLDTLQSNQGYMLAGANENDGFGYFARPIQDINGDGVNDLVVGAPGANGKWGIAYLLYTPYKCMEGCAQCSSIDKCDYCSSGFGLSNGICIPCPSATHTVRNGICTLKCPANCANCTKPGTCDACYLSYGFLNGECVTCPSATHVLRNGTCQFRCSDFCESCSQPNTCDSCNPAYLYVNGRCIVCPFETHTLKNHTCVVKCSQNCASCTQSNTCDSCIEGYGFINGLCQNCSPSRSYTLLPNGTCAAKCRANCKSCSRPNECDVCSEGYGFLLGECQICPPATHILRNGFCEVKCKANCRSCSRPNTCDICSYGFGLLNGECQICPSDTHTLSDGVCKVKCSANCKSCSIPNTCNSCSEGFGLLKSECQICPSGTHILNDGFCVAKCTPNCAYCTKPGSCDICTFGFGLLNNTCQTCPSETHFLNDGVCQERRPENCAVWTGPDVCNVCTEGFGFLEGKCQICPAESHILSNGTCKDKCPANCAQCTQRDLCDVCNEGFGFLNDSCVVCPAKTYFLNNGFCIEDHDAWELIKDFIGELFH